MWANPPPVNACHALIGATRYAPTTIQSNGVVLAVAVVLDDLRYNNNTYRQAMWLFESLNPFEKLNEQTVGFEWVKASQPLMCIEAILSGHAVTVAAAVQPYLRLTPIANSYMTPFPHTVVVIKQRHPETRARRVGRLSLLIQQFIQQHNCNQ